MKKNLQNEELYKVAKRVVWYQKPADTLTNTTLFLSHVMTYGTIEDILIIQKYYSQNELITTLKMAPPGIFDPRSWAYWHTVLKQLPVPPLHKRNL